MFIMKVCTGKLFVWWCRAKLFY